MDFAPDYSKRAPLGAHIEALASADVGAPILIYMHRKIPSFNTKYYFFAIYKVAGPGISSSLTISINPILDKIELISL